MKSYLNREEKTLVLTLASFVAYLTAKSDEWAEHNRNKDSVKSMRMAKSFIFRVTDALLKDVDNAEKAKIFNQVAKMEVVVKYHDEAVREYKRMQELDSVTPIKTEDFFEICEQALGVCQTCKDKPDGCRLRELFIEHDVPVFNESPGEGQCPYRVEGAK